MAALLAALLPTFVSCKKQEPDKVQPGVAISLNPVSNKAGEQFVRVTAGKEWSISLDFAGAEPWAEISPISGSGSRNDLTLSWKASPLEGARSVLISIRSAAGESSLTFTQNGYKMPAKKYGEDVAGARWLELPETAEGDGREFFYRRMSISDDKGVSKIVRNFSFDYSYGDFLAIWVAYPLNTTLIGSSFGRSEAWAFDPLMPAALQQDVTDSYHTGWARGHQIPSADRQGDYERNASTYYGTNMTPQDYDFNGGIWAGLEQKVRNLCKNADTLYVVTGCVPGPNTMPNAGNRINIPAAYFKALLYYRKEVEDQVFNLGKYGGYSGVGVYLNHDGSLSGSLYPFAMTLEELQEKTGLRFFVNLPAEIRSKVLVQDPSWAKSYLQ